MDRRRFIRISAAAAGAALLPFAMPWEAARAHLIEWRGTSLGAVATVRIHHGDRTAAQQLIRTVAVEARRLERVFSLYLPDSALCELNRRGVLISPPAELSDLLAVCDQLWHATDGLFDPTVQPLWQCYAEHFAEANRDSKSLPAPKLKEALELVGWKNVRLDPYKIVFNRLGMGMTLNGIAQGYVTDRIVELLRSAGIESCLVDLGEIRGLGGHPDGRPWRVALDSPSGENDKAKLSLVNKAIATSSAAGFQFDVRGEYNHLFNPLTGKCAHPDRSITVVAATAVMADALSTAFALMREDQIRLVLSRLDTAKAYITTDNATRTIAF